MKKGILLIGLLCLTATVKAIPSVYVEFEQLPHSRIDLVVEPVDLGDGVTLVEYWFNDFIASYGSSESSRIEEDNAYIGFRPYLEIGTFTPKLVVHYADLSTLEVIGESYTITAPVPAPDSGASMTLLGCGLLGLTLVRHIHRPGVHGRGV